MKADKHRGRCPGESRTVGARRPSSSGVSAPVFLPPPPIAPPPPRSGPAIRVRCIRGRRASSTRIWENAGDVIATASRRLVGGNSAIRDGRTR